MESEEEPKGTQRTVSVLKVMVIVETFNVVVVLRVHQLFVDVFV